MMDELAKVLNLGGTLGTIAVLIWFCRRFLDRWETSQRELVEALRGVLKENNELLIAVRSHLAGDTDHWRKPPIAPRHKATHESS